MQGKIINKVDVNGILSCLETYQMGSALIFLKDFLLSCQIFFTPFSEINTRVLKSLLIALRLLFVIS